MCKDMEKTQPKALNEQKHPLFQRVIDKFGKKMEI